MKLRLMILVASLVAGACCGQEARPKTDQELHIVDKIAASLTNRTSWATNAVKVWLRNPDVVVTCRPSTGKAKVMHAWPRTQNDFHVPMIRIDAGDRLYEVSEDEYRQLEALNEKVPNHTSDGIRQPADGLPKPSR